MPDRVLNEEQLARYEADGYVIVNDFLDEEERNLLLKIAKADQQLAGESVGRVDGEGGISRIALRFDLHEDIYSAIVRSRRMVDSMERILGGEVYQYHHKMMMKEPLVGGAWEWHQDYGYWYNDAFLWPLMASCMIAVDRATRENGCLQVLKGSHHLGRLNHGRIGDQTGADLDHVRPALERLERVYVELEPGAALFFHCNLLHRSDQNRSPHPRWGFICCYNAARNYPYREAPHTQYRFLEKWPDESILETGRRQWAELQQLAAK